MSVPVRSLSLLLVVVALVSACSAGNDESAPDDGRTVEEYYADMRELEMFAGSTDEQLDELATGTCQEIDELLAAGATNAEAVDVIYRAGVEAGLSEADSMAYSMFIIGTHCPIDISE